MSCQEVADGGETCGYRDDDDDDDDQLIPVHS
jgi:hypothetical protein